jgi:hypothetical protein
MNSMSRDKQVNYLTNWEEECHHLNNDKQDFKALYLT